MDKYRLYQYLPYHLKIGAASYQAFIYKRKRKQGLYKSYVEIYKKLWYADTEDVISFSKGEVGHTTY